MTGLPLALQPEPFRWEVSLQEPVVPIAQEQPEPTPAPPVPKNVEPRLVERTLVAQRQTESVEHVVREAEPLERQAQVQTRVAEQARESLHETGDPIVRQVQASSLSTPPVMASSGDVIAPHVQAVATSHAQQAVVQPQATIVQDADTVHVVPTPHTAPLIRQVRAVATPQATIVPDADTVRDVVPTAHAASLVQHVPIRERVLRSSPHTQADYGWLRDSIMARIQQLKRYPSRAKMNEWEGKVIVQAVIREDGSIVDLLVAESSGHDVLDQDALLVVKTASPLTLKHPLGKAQVPILVPISYRLDG
jgi:protein TonB